ncbi:MAG: glycerophosphodiester phosphodiesterase family protein [Candidatus Marinimicrobia bacterium]|nr:glycerophosphodiester phosphodiesterase family protein [Candidatus Neomarinimicrobiota bacterium]
MKAWKRILQLSLVFSLLVFLQAQEKHYLVFESPAQLQEYFRWSPDKAPIISAHRGGPMEGYPENCIETFEHALLYAPCLIECDVARSKDSVLVLMHDRTLDRTTTGSGLVSDYTLEELKKLYLKDNQGNITPYRIPTLAEVLDWARGRAIVELDIKGSIAPEEIVAIIREKRALSYTVVITYNIEVAKKYHALEPQLMISASARGIEGAQRLLESGINPSCIIAFVGVYEPEKKVYELLHKNSIMAILGTMGNLDRKAEKHGISVYKKLINNGADILATNNVPLAASILCN